jgi:ketosteroid isomerase-like protein
MGALLDHVRGYYEALNTGDADAVAAFFTDDAVHYYTRREPHVGGRAIAENAAFGVGHVDGQWQLVNGIDDGEQAVIEWSMTWKHPETGERRLDRGTEWFAFRDGLICEVRAYFHTNAKKRSGDLMGFDHAGRGHVVLDG